MENSQKSPESAMIAGLAEYMDRGAAEARDFAHEIGWSDSAARAPLRGRST